MPNVQLSTLNARLTKQNRAANAKRRVCFVTGTRAEFGLMRSTLLAIQNHPGLELQIIATGMHLSAAHGRTINSIRADGWTVNATVPWKTTKANDNSIATGRAMAGIASALNKLKSDIVLVVGDRVEAFAAASAGHLSSRVVAHIHGGDRALGQVDDSLRHAITKLAHLHFPATAKSKQRLLKLGEDAWRVHLAGSPGIDGITQQAAARTIPGNYALLILHPTDSDEEIEAKRAQLVLKCVDRIGFDRVVIVYPNNDPGSVGIIQTWEELAQTSKDTRVSRRRSLRYAEEPGRTVNRADPALRRTSETGVVGADQGPLIFRDVPRSQFLALLRDAAVLVGNSSSGIIEAASFGTPVVNIGNRQLGRECGRNVTHMPFKQQEIELSLKTIWNAGKPRRYPAKNIYGGHQTGVTIARELASVSIDARLLRKLIAY